ncbi:MAG TPA: HAD-IC family P-type ATPase, partial [Thermomicrobiales bacterium]|nr:HAD-IC family P-type ATPase [Thermomicrobiales bacterium]
MKNRNGHIELAVEGMDCAGCARTVQQAIADVPGVESVDVLLGGEKAIIRYAEAPPDEARLRQAVERAGYRIGRPPAAEPMTSNGAPQPARPAADADSENLSKRILGLFGLIFGAVLLVVIAGEVLGLFDVVMDAVPLPLGILIVLALGYPVFKQVVLAALRRRVIAHTLMAVGALAALAAGEWVTAVIVVFFMRMGDYAERFTTEQARSSVRSLTRMAPRTARVIREDGEHVLPVDQVRPGDVVLVRPGEQIPVDGIVTDGHATVDQSAITGESMPVDLSSGGRAYAATIAQLGALRIRAEAAGRDTTFGRVIEMVEHAERHRGEVQRYADRFSTYYLPFVATVALATYLLGGGLMATIAVLVVACSCAFALATPAAILASVGAAAGHGLLIKGGKYIEQLAAADVVLIDKTGTLTLGRPEIERVIPLNGYPEEELIRLAAGAERHSEHPLAAAV